MGSMAAKIRVGFPVDEAMRSEHGEAVVRPVLEFHDDYDPRDRSDRGPHVERVGMIAVDVDGRVDDDDPPPPPPR